jgi:hypothetical protein
MNWALILGTIRRRTLPSARVPAPGKILRRGANVLLAACLVAATAYATMAVMSKPMPSEKRATIQTASATQAPPLRKGRPQSFRGGLRELDTAVLVVIFVVIIGRYVLRIRL